MTVPTELADLVALVSSGQPSSPSTPGLEPVDDAGVPLAVDYTEAGRLIGVSPATIYRLVRDGRLRAIAIGAAKRIPRTELERFVAAQLDPEASVDTLDRPEPEVPVGAALGLDGPGSSTSGDRGGIEAPSRSATPATSTDHRQGEPPPVNDTDLDEPDPRLDGLAAFLAARRAGRFPRIPDALAVALAALDDAEALRRSLMSRPVEGLAAFITATVGAVAGGSALPDAATFADAAHEATKAAERQAAATSTLPAIAAQLRARAAGAIDEAIPELLGGLRAELDEVMVAARAADKAIGDLDIGDAEAVAGATDAQRAGFIALGQLVGRYHAIRAGQRCAYVASGRHAPGWNSSLVDHDWQRVVIDRQLHEFADVRGKGTVGGPKVQRLRAIARRRDVWLPDFDQLAEAVAAAGRSETQRAEHEAALAGAGA